MHHTYLIAICTFAVPTASVSSLSNTITSDTHGLKEDKDNEGQDFPLTEVLAFR